MGIGNLFGKSGFAAEVEQGTKALRVTERPQDVVGSYCMTVSTGTMAAALGAGSPIFSFRMPAPAAAIIGNPLVANFALIRSIHISVQAATGFAAGAAAFNLFIARNFTVQDTTGTSSTSQANNSLNGKLRASFPTTQADIFVAGTASCTAGTRVKDNFNCAKIQVNFDTSANLVELVRTQLWGPLQGNNYPIVLAGNEGVIIQATVPGTGTWVADITTSWDEVVSF